MTDTLIIDDASTLKEKLAALSADILAPGDFHDKLAPAIKNYSELLFNLTQISVDEHQARENIYTGHGKAIGTLWAALCTNELYRTQRFCRGLYKAVNDKLKQNANRPVHVIYAGTGPFATLALPVIMQFKPSQLQFTLLEINNESYTILKKLLKTLDIEGYIRRLELCDAITWKVPTGDVDIVLSETMNKALIKEPQINIMLNMAAQLPMATFIPQNISVGMAMQNRDGSSTYLTGLYSFNRETYLKIIAQSAGQQHWLFDNTIVNFLPATNNNLIYTTDITVYADERLTGTDCSLNLPQKVKPKLPEDATVVQFTYQDGENPGFIYTIMG